MRVIDLRSDTFTKPSAEMWEMLRSLDNSKIGDDEFGEDPTVNELEEKAAKKVGKEAAIYVTSGTQANLVSLLSHTKRGDEVMVEEKCHIYRNETSSATRIAGLNLKTYPSEKGVPSIDQLQNIINNNNKFVNPTKVICAENTHNYHGGAIIKPEILRSIKSFAEKNELKFHLDGARIFNAAIGLGIDVTELTKHVDSVMFCISKGLSCPVGSLVAGPKTFVSEARKYRKMVGGGMRQVGIIASFGLVALEPSWINRLKEDHKNAKNLAEGIERYELPVEISKPDTNIVIMSVPEGVRIGKVVRSLGNEGILAFNIDKQKIRFVTHFGINEDDIEYSVKKIGQVLNKILSSNKNK